MESKVPFSYDDDLMRQVGHIPAIFQDMLGAGYRLNQVEEFSDWARGEGLYPVTINKLRELRSHETHGQLARLVLSAAMERVVREL